MTTKNIQQSDDEGKKIRVFNKPFDSIITTICVLFSLLFLFNANFNIFHGLGQASMLLMFTMLLVFLIYPLSKKDSKKKIILDLVLSIVGFISFFRVFVTEGSLLERGGQPELWDLILGGIAIILLIESIRRTIGWALPILIILSLLYAFFGPYFPGLLQHNGLSYERLIQTLYLTTEGIFTTPIGAVAKFVLVYIILGTILQASGTGKVFIDLSLAIFGRFRGGSAKVAVISSSLFGSLSGSSVSNVMATGSITIPLMKSAGFKSKISGAIEAVSSTGGQLMPPVMGATAFVMAEVMGTSYLNIIIAALIPAILYYVSLFCMVDLEAAKMGLKGTPKEDLPNLFEILRERGHLLIPIITLIVFLGVMNYSPQKSAFWTIIVAMIIPQLRKTTRMPLRSFFSSLKSGAISVLMVTVVCGGAGIIIGILLYSGLALSLSSLLISLSGEYVLLLLIYTATASIVLGMGLPTTAAYLLLAVLVAPALVTMGIDKMSAHLFVFYFGSLSAITPPVAVAAFAAAAVARSNPMSTGLTAMRFGVAGFIIPFMFVFAPELLIKGSQIQNIILTFFTSVLGVYGIASVLQNYFVDRLSFLQRCLLLVSSILLVIPENISDLAGIILFGSILLHQYLKGKQEKANIFKSTAVK